LDIKRIAFICAYKKSQYFIFAKKCSFSKKAKKCLIIKSKSLFFVFVA